MYSRAKRTKSSIETETLISRNEVSKITKEGSIIIPDNFATLEDLKSVAFRHVEKIGPFDVVNLDFCNSISSFAWDRNHQALFNLCNYQINKRREPWLLFLTTLADSQLDFGQISTDQRKYPDHP